MRELGPHARFDDVLLICDTYPSSYCLSFGCFTLFVGVFVMDFVRFRDINGKDYGYATTTSSRSFNTLPVLSI